MGKRQTGGWVFVLAAMLLATGLRVLAAENNLWFDEIISVEMASQMSGPAGTFTEFNYDNNHYLNTLWVYCLGKHNNELLYRLPAIIAGILTIPAVWWALCPWGRFAQRAGALLIAISHVHVHYSSEARGYALQILFAIIAFGYLERFHRKDRPALAWLFGLFCSLSIVSHLLSINFFLACLFWTIAVQTRRDQSLWEQAKRLVWCHALPVLTGAVLYLVHVRHLQFGGGPKHNTLEVIASAWSLLLGIAEPGPGRLLCGVLALSFVIAAIYVCRASEAKQGETNSHQWRFFVVFLLLIPLIRITIPGSLLFVRYFLLQLTFGVMLLAIAMSVYLTRRANTRRVVWLTLLVLVAANMVQNIHLIRTGRGDYQSVVNRIATDSPNQSVTIGSTNNILDGPVLDYFGEQTELVGKHFEIREPDEYPDWLILHRTMDCATRPQPLQPVVEIDEHIYRLTQLSRASYLSGFEWRCYRRVTPLQRQVKVIPAAWSR
ncbi:MAG: hypothetical protein ACR2NP_22190 [Pirellulaceae bacterium]